MAILPSVSATAEPTIAFLWLSPTSNLLMQVRRFEDYFFRDLSDTVDVLSPLRNVDLGLDANFADVPYSCPAARTVLPISEESVLVIGDEYSVLYSLTYVPQSPKAKRGSISSQDPVTTSPRASAVSRSPQAESTLPGKRRKSSAAAGRLNEATKETWAFKPVWRARQGFGTILA